MRRKRKVSLAQVERFISNGLRTKLRDDLMNHRMLREADLESCIYYHLRRLLRQDDCWRVFARKHVRGVYPDLVIVKEKKLQLIMELKWRSDHIARKDRAKLGDFLGGGRVHKTYFLTTAFEKGDYKKRGRKRAGEKYRLKEHAVPLDLKGARLQRWREEREEYKCAFG